MASEIEPTGGRGGEESRRGGLFQGMSFWLSHNVPQRSRFKELIQKNGGNVRLCEKDADVQLVDHKRKDLPSNVHSYQFIEKSIQKGKLEDLKDYIAGPSAPRPVGATNIQPRAHRRAYTIEDDQILWDYMQPYERDPSARIQGNRIYQELAAKYPQHTYQSWRDRYLKRLRGRTRPGGMAESTSARNGDEQASRELTSAAGTAGPAVVIVQKKLPAQAPTPQDRKRKRSPVSPAPDTLASNDTSRIQQERATAPHTEAPLSPHTFIHRRDASHHGSLASPKKARTAAGPAKPNIEKAMSRRPVEGSSPVPPEVLTQTAEDASQRELPWTPKRARTTAQQPSHTQQGRAIHQDQEVPIPPDSLIQKGPSHHEITRSPKRTQTETEPTAPTPGKTAPEGPSEEADAGLNDLLELPFFPGSPEPEEATPDKDIDAWIDEHLDAGMGTLEQIIEALRCTSMDPELAEEVLKSLVAGKGIPADMRGVWTAQDDRCVEAQDTRDIQRVLEKHGSDLFNYRWEYLNMARAEGLEGPPAIEA
ncbi:TRF2-interacting telomeric protein/Rap1 C terminal domain-containing protein [Aspergillus egyptiacus]|nr:TRF2-interacting telomeric protein/Rap1 C terminal domain-containing protein [Aspergillus egyptiacus]